jgi:hypothetical protein
MHPLTERGKVQHDEFKGQVQARQDWIPTAPESPTRAVLETHPERVPRGLADNNQRLRHFWDRSLTGQPSRLSIPRRHLLQGPRPPTTGLFLKRSWSPPGRHRRMPRGPRFRCRR